MSEAVDKINELQRRVLAGDTDISNEEMAAAINALRAERGFAAKATAEKRAVREKAKTIDIAAIFGGPKP